MISLPMAHLLSALTRIETVPPLYVAHPEIVSRVKALASTSLHPAVLRVLTPILDRLERVPIRHRDSEAIRSARAFDTEKARLLLGERHHGLRGGIVTIGYAGARVLR